MMINEILMVIGESGDIQELKQFFKYSDMKINEN